MFSWDDCGMIFALFDSFVMRRERMIFDHCDWLVSYVCLCVYIYIYYIFIHIFLYFHVKHDESRRQTKSNVLHAIDILRWEKRSSPHPPIFLQVCLHCDHWRNPQVHSNR